MVVNSLKELDKLIQLCRKRGIQSIKVDNIEMHLGEQKPKTTYKKDSLIKDWANNPYNPGEITIPTSIPDTIETPDELTEEQLMFYSAQSQVQS